MRQVGFIYKHMSRFPIASEKLYLIWNIRMCTVLGRHVTVLRFIGAFDYQNTAFLLTVAPRYGSGG